MSKSKTKLIQLYQLMAELTKPECANCRGPYSCCNSAYCHETIEWAATQWATTLVPTNHPNLPLLGPSGCIAAPHLRPCCTLHTCEINSLGYKKGDNNWTKKYFKLRQQIDAEEFKHYHDE